MEAPILIGFTPARSFGPSSGARSRWVFRSPPLCAGIRGALSLLTCRLYRLSSESDGCISSGVAPLYVLRRGVSGWSCHLCEFHVSLMRRTSSMLFDVSVRLCLCMVAVSGAQRVFCPSLAVLEHGLQSHRSCSRLCLLTSLQVRNERRPGMSCHLPFPFLRWLLLLSSLCAFYVEGTMVGDMEVDVLGVSAVAILSLHLCRCCIAILVSVGLFPPWSGFTAPPYL